MYPFCVKNCLNPEPPETSSKLSHSKPLSPAQRPGDKMWHILQTVAVLQYYTAELNLALTQRFQRLFPNKFRNVQTETRCLVARSV